jgi:signal transduction histidine kinase
MLKSKKKKQEIKIMPEYSVETSVKGEPELNLPDSPEFYCRAIESSGGITFYFNYGDQEDGINYPVTGSGVKRVFGIMPGKFTEKTFDSLVTEIEPYSGDMPESLPEACRKLRNGEVEIYMAELKMFTAGGESNWFSCTLLPVIGMETGKVTGIFGILYDISDRKLIMESMRKIRQKEEECDRLKISFLQNISHEIRTPLNAIVGFSSLLGEYGDGIDPEHWNEFREIVISNSDRLLDIIDSIIEISRIEAGSVRMASYSVNLNWILLKVYAQFKVDASDKDVDLAYSAPLSDRESEIETDGHRLTRVLVNLVDNALKFTSEGRVDFGYNLKDGTIEFYVSDTGIGIPAGHQDSIFRMFYQADSSYSRGYGGIGLGLAIAKAYVGMLGGEIWFISQSGEGSVFRFTIPWGKE